MAKEEIHDVVEVRWLGTCVWLQLLIGQPAFHTRLLRPWSPTWHLYT